MQLEIAPPDISPPRAQCEQITAAAHQCDGLGVADAAGWRPMEKNVLSGLMKTPAYECMQMSFLFNVLFK